MSARTFVVGTAGHVDHGKSSLVRALTGTDPDRLAEEQRRQMTIDLGFAELTTPAGNRVHLVDVPGHERFVRNMLAGAGGIDAALVTIAADDGPMPQTREHLAILDLLGISHGVVALSKADLVDGEWLAFVSASIRELLQGTTLATVEIVPVSSITGEGLSQLLEALDRALAPIERVSSGKAPRLPIDRVFSLPGFGTIVTGTLLDAPLAPGDRIAVVPGERMSRVRGLQTFGESVETARPGSRVAVNLSGLETSKLRRGDVVTSPGAVSPAMRIDARVRLIGSSERALRHNDELILFTGSSETPAKVALLDREFIEPTEEGWIQLRLSRQVAVLPGDRFILRRPSPAETIGGGVMFELDAPRHKRFQVAVIARLEQLAASDPAKTMLAWIGNRFVTESELRSHSPQEIIDGLTASDRIRFAGEAGSRVAATTSIYESTTRRMQDAVDSYHQRHPLQVGIPRETLRQSIDLPRPIFDAILADDARLVDAHSVVHRAGRRIELDAAQLRVADRYLQVLADSGFQPPAPGDFGIDPELIDAMAAMGSIVPVVDGIVYLPRQIERAQERLLDILEGERSTSLAEFRDALGITRKYAQALLEYFDRQRVTRRVGDRRVAFRREQQREGEPHQ